MRKLVKLALFLLIAHALYRFGPVYVKDVSLRWDVKEAAHAWQDLNPEQVTDEILALAARNNVPITREHVDVRNTGSRVAVDLSYVVPVEFVPGWKYPWTFENSIETWTLNRAVKAP